MPRGEGKQSSLADASGYLNSWNYLVGDEHRINFQIKAVVPTKSTLSFAFFEILPFRGPLMLDAFHEELRHA